MKRLLPLLLAGCAVSSTPAPDPHPALTVDRIYSEPPLAGALLPNLQWSPDGSALLFLQDSHVVALDLATSARRVILDFAAIPADERPALDPKPIGRAAPGRFWWSPSADALLVHHRGDLWIWKDNAPARLTRTASPIHDPKWSPDGSRVSFIRDHDVWTVDRDGRESRLTTGGSPRLLNGELDWVYPEELGISTATWWSPDSRSVAFLQLDESAVSEFPLVDYRPRLGKITPELYPKAGDPNPKPRVGIATLDGAVTWVDLGSDSDIYIPRVWWLPDGRLCILRLNRLQTRLEFLFADAAGRAAVAHVETDPAWVSVHDDVRFFDDGFLIASERSGWRHLYFHRAGGAVREITQGPWEVTRLVSADRDWIFFESTEGDFLQRHVWKVPFAGGERVRVTGAPGWHGATMSPKRDLLLDIHSSATTPPRASILRADGSTLLALDPAAPPLTASLGLVAPEFLRIHADGVELPAMILRPPGFDPARKYPVLVHTYGGPGAQLVADRWGGSTFLWHNLLARQGIIVFTLDNRGSGGRGRDWERLLHRRLGHYELRDQLHGVDWLKRQPWVDGARIGIWGWSYGGFMACQALANSDAFKVGIAVAPVTDWRLYDTIYTERYLLRPQDNPDGYRASSPVHRAAHTSGRLLLVHGTDDDNVHFQNAVVHAEQLIEARRPFDFMLYPGKAHGISGRAARIHLFEMMTDFLRRHL